MTSADEERGTTGTVACQQVGDDRPLYVAAADIGGTRLRMMLADLRGVPVAHWSALLAEHGKTPGAICELANQGLRAMCASADTTPEAVLHLAAGAPGITNVTVGTVLAAPNLEDWNHVPLRHLLTRATGLPCTVENDVNLAALGEHQHGAARGIDSFVFVAVGTGVGASVFLRGAIHHGAEWAAGELGYCGVRDEPWSPVRARETGQMERRLGGAGLEGRWRAMLAEDGEADPALATLHAPAILDRAQAGDALARRLLGEVAGQLADLLTGVALLLNPELVVLGGGVGSHPALAAATQELLCRNDFAHPAVRSSSLGAEAQLYGGAALAAAAARTTTAAAPVAEQRGMGGLGVGD